MRTSTLFVFLFPAVLSAVSSAGLAAQAPTIAAYSDVGVGVRFWRIQQAPTEVVRFAKKGTVFAKPTTVTATHVNGWSSVQVTPTIAGKTATFVIDENGAFNGQHYTWNYVGTATQQFNRPHEFLLRVPANAAGNQLLVDIENSAVRPAGVVDKSGFRRELNLGTKAVDVRIRCYVQVSGQFGKGGYGFQVGLTVNKDDALRVKSFGANCGTAMTISDTVTGVGHRVTLDVRGGFGSAPIALMFGARKASIRWPGSPCRCSSI